MIKGRHILHFGGEILTFRDNSTPWGNMAAANLNFNGYFTQLGPSQGGGLGYADFLLGQVQSWNATNTPITGARQKSPQVFIQDDIKLRPNLTLNLGLRYQWQRPWSEVHNRLGMFDPTIKNPVTGTLGAMWFGGDNGRTTLEKAVHVWLPRISMASTSPPTRRTAAACSSVPASAGSTNSRPSTAPAWSGGRARSARSPSPS
jgi:hypothetical protein